MESENCDTSARMKWTGVFLIVAGCLPAATVYDVVGLGGYGGNSAAANGIAANGRTAGTGSTPSGAQVAFAGGAGTGSATTLGANASAADVNSAGTVVGTSWDSGGPRATVWRAGIADAILGVDSYGLGINEAGDIAGSRLEGTQMQAFVQSGSSFTDIGIGGSTWSAAYDINSSGGAAGYSMQQNGSFQAFVWDGAQGSRLLGTLGGGNSYAQALSDTGLVVGSSLTNASRLHAFVYDGVMRDLGTLGGSLSAAYDVNTAGQVVGYSMDGTGRSRAFVWLNGVMVDLNALVDAGSGWTLTAAYGINSTGQIVGEGTYYGQSTAFRLDPVQAAATGGLNLVSADAEVPEPIGMAAVGLILLWLGSRRLRRQPPRDGVG